MELAFSPMHFILFWCPSCACGLCGFSGLFVSSSLRRWKLLQSLETLTFFLFLLLFFWKVEVVALFFWLYLTRFYRLPFSGGLGHLSGKKQQRNCCSTPYCLPPPFTATTRLSTQQTQASGRSEDDDATSRAGTVFLLSLPF